MIAKISQISCQSGTITAYINDPFRLHLEDSLKEDFIAAFSRGIYHDHICVYAIFLIFPGKNFFCLSYKKFHIGDII